MSDSSTSENNVRYENYSDSLISSEPANVPQEAQSDSDELSDGKEKQSRDFVIETLAQPEQLSVPQTEEHVPDETRGSLNDYMQKYETDSNWLTEFDQDIEDLIKQAHGEDDQDDSDREDEAEKDVSDAEHSSNNYSILRHESNSDGLFDSDLEILSQLEQSKDDDMSNEADRARDLLNDFIRKYESDSDWLTECDLDIEDLIRQAHGEDDQDESGREAEKDVSDGEDSLNTYCTVKYEADSDQDASDREDETEKHAADVLIDSDLESLPKHVEREGEEEALESDRHLTDCTREYNYDADVDGMTDSEPETNQVHIELDLFDEVRKEGNPHVSGPSSRRLEPSLECESDDYDDYDCTCLPDNNPKEVLSEEEANAQEPSVQRQSLECNYEAVLEDFASSGVDYFSESNNTNISSDQLEQNREEEGVETTTSDSSIGTKLRRFSIDIETDGFFSTDSDAGRASKDAELKMISDDDQVTPPDDQEQHVSKEHFFLIFKCGLYRQT